MNTPQERLKKLGEHMKNVRYGKGFVPSLKVEEFENELHDIGVQLKEVQRD